MICRSDFLPFTSANDPEAKRIHDILQTVGKNKTDAGNMKQFLL
jgi:hypothetical protein